jgi:hypothetical protein
MKLQRGHRRGFRPRQESRQQKKSAPMSIFRARLFRSHTFSGHAPLFLPSVFLLPCPPFFVVSNFPASTRALLADFRRL